jgi:hypothetical protein
VAAVAGTCLQPVDLPAVAETGVQPAAPRAEEPDRAGEPDRVETTNEAAGCTSVTEPAPSEPDFLALAHLCTEFGRVENRNEVQPLLREAARILDATGVIVWVWDGLAALKPALAHGYSDRVLAQLPAVRRDADNATAGAFRSAQTCAVRGGEDTSGALVVPMLTPRGCAGVLAIELPPGREQAGSVRAAATIVAAVLAQLTGVEGASEARSATQMIGAEHPSAFHA